MYLPNFIGLLDAVLYAPTLYNDLYSFRISKNNLLGKNGWGATDFMWVELFCFNGAKRGA